MEEKNEKEKKKEMWASNKRREMRTRIRRRRIKRRIEIEEGGEDAGGCSVGTSQEEGDGSEKENKEMNENEKGDGRQTRGWRWR